MSPFKDTACNDTSDGSFVDQDRLFDHIANIIKTLSPDSILIQTKVILPNPFFCDSHTSLDYHIDTDRNHVHLRFRSESPIISFIKGHLN